MKNTINKMQQKERGNKKHYQSQMIHLLKNVRDNSLNREHTLSDEQQQEDQDIFRFNHIILVYIILVDLELVRNFSSYCYN